MNHLGPVRSLAVLLACLAILAAASCGGGDLARKYDAYESAVTPILERERAVGKRAHELLTAQVSDVEADPDRWRAFVGKEAVPFYAGLPAEMARVAPAEPELAAAHAILVKFAACEERLARYMAAHVEVMAPGPATSELSRRQNEAEQAVADYDAVKDPNIVDPRYGVLKQAAETFLERCMKPRAQGRISARDVADVIERSILPGIRRLRGEKYGDDQRSVLLKRAILASEEFYDAFMKCLPLVDEQFEFGREVARMTEEADGLLAEFKDALAAVRRQL